MIFQFSPGFGTGASLVPISRYHGLGTRFSGGYLNFSYFGTSLVLFWLQIRWNLMLLVLEPRLTGTKTAQEFQNQNKKVAVLSVF